jgi:peroxiredoxin Q/BCP
MARRQRGGMMKLQIGDTAPAFTTQDTTGKTVSLADFRGKKVVLYFYPKDDTPGCTKEACSFRDHAAEIRAKGAEVLGVSSDGVEAHQKFTSKLKLNFPLLADADHAIGKAYGTIGGAFGILGWSRRWTLVIDEKGKVGHIFDKVDPTTHVDEVLAVL